MKIFCNLQFILFPLRINSLTNRSYMKYRLFCTFLLLIIVCLTHAQEDKNINPEALPAQARFFIKTDFAKKNIIYVTEHKGDKTYEVLTADSTRFEFNKDGQWIYIESPFSDIPVFVIPHRITSAIRTSYGPNHQIIQIRRLSRGRYDVVLSNGINLRFNKNYEIDAIRKETLIKQQNQFNREISK